MGIVYRARDRLLDREVALKLIRNEADTASRTRFEREAKILAKTPHRNIVVIFDFEPHEESPFIAMELLRGRNLRQAMKETPSMTLRERIGVIRQVLAGLECAHGAGIVHRDIKPANLFLTTAGEVKILDFGVARILDGSSTTSNILGSELYMSPEQWESAAVDERSDLFSVGVTLYELIAGVPPFAGKTRWETMRKTLNERADFTPILTNAPALIPILRKALAKDAADRYQSASDFASAIDSARIEGTSLASTDTDTLTIDIAPPVVHRKRVLRKADEVSKTVPVKRQRQTRFPKPPILWRSMRPSLVALVIVILGMTGWTLYRSEKELEPSATTEPTATSAARAPFKRLFEDYDAALREFPNMPPVGYPEHQCIERALAEAESRLSEESQGRLQDVESLRWSLNHCAATRRPAEGRSPIIASVQALLTEQARSSSCPGLDSLAANGIHSSRTSAALGMYVRCNELALWKIDRLETLGDYAAIGLYLVQGRQRLH